MDATAMSSLSLETSETSKWESPREFVAKPCSMNGFTHEVC